MALLPPPQHDDSASQLPSSRAAGVTPTPSAPVSSPAPASPAITSTAITSTATAGPPMPAVDTADKRNRRKAASGAFPPMESKAPAPFGGEKAASGAFPPTASKAPTPFGCAKAASGAFPPMESKASTGGGDGGDGEQLPVGKVVLADKPYTDEGAAEIAAFLRPRAPGISRADRSDVIAGRQEDEALRVLDEVCVPRKKMRAEGGGGGDRSIAAKLAGRAKSQDENAPPGRKMNEAGSVAHSTEARTREEGKKARPVAQTCTVKGCSKRRQPGCNGMCIAHSREAGNPVPRPVARTCTVKGCSKRRQSGCNGMCTAHSTEAGNPVPAPPAFGAGIGAGIAATAKSAPAPAPATSAPAPAPATAAPAPPPPRQYFPPNICGMLLKHSVSSPTPTDKYVRGLVLTAGRDIFQIIDEANLMFHPVQGLREGLPLPFNNLEELDNPTTIDSRYVLYVITDGHAVEKVGMTSNIASRRLQYATKCAANPENPKYLVVICNLGLLPLDVDGKVEEVWDRLTHTLKNDQNVPWVVNDLWHILRERGGERLFKRKIWLHLAEIGAQQLLITQPALPCEGEGFPAAGRLVERWTAEVESVKGEIIAFLEKFLETQPGLEKIKAANPMMMQSWKPRRREFHEERNCDPPLPMSSQITVTESIVGEGNWVDSLPFAAKPNDPTATYSTDYTKEKKDGGIKTIQNWILKMEPGTFAILDTNHILFGDGNGLSDFLQKFGLIKKASYFDEGELVVWSSESIVLLVVPPWCRCAYYHPNVQMALNVRVRCCLAAEVARQVCSFVRQKEPPEVTCSQHPGILAAYANALLIEGMHLTGHATRIVNCVVRDIFSPPSVNACVQNGLAKLGGTNQSGERGRHPVSLKAQYELRNASNPEDVRYTNDQTLKDRVCCYISKSQVTITNFSNDERACEEMAWLANSVLVLISTYQDGEVVTPDVKRVRWKAVKTYLMSGSANGFGTLFEMMHQEYQEREKIFGNTTDRRGISNEMMGEHDVEVERFFELNRRHPYFFIRNKQVPPGEDHKTFQVPRTGQLSSRNMYPFDPALFPSSQCFAGIKEKLAKCRIRPAARNNTNAARSYVPAAEDGMEWRIVRIGHEFRVGHYWGGGTTKSSLNSWITAAKIELVER